MPTAGKNPCRAHDNPPAGDPLLHRISAPPPLTLKQRGVRSVRPQSRLQVVRPSYPEGTLRVALFADPAGNVLGIWQENSDSPGSR